MTTKKQWRLSASFIGAFKACAMRCYLKYILGWRPIEDTDSQRQGTNWHKILEILGMKPGSVCPECGNKGQKDPKCPLCLGSDILPEDMMDAIIRHLNKVYETVPLSKTRDEWLAERAKLLYSLCGYKWHYADDKFEVIAEEIQFRLPVRNPRTGRALPNVVLDGMIDKIVRSPNGIYYVEEHKSTAKPIDPDSLYWSHLNLDTQTKLYVFAARQLQLAGELEPYGIKPTDPLISGVRYDVWHKPQISPKKLTQAESKKFVADGMYMDEEFEVIKTIVEDSNGNQSLCVNDEPAEVTPGAKEGTFAIRETPEMYGARLLKEIGENPEKYFARREISRTDKEMEKFEYEIYNIYQTVRIINKNNAWWMDEHQCEATFRCPYIPICYNDLDLDTVPEGFENIFKEKKDE